MEEGDVLKSAETARTFFAFNSFFSFSSFPFSFSFFFFFGGEGVKVGKP